MNARETMARMQEDLRRAVLGEMRQAHELATLAGRGADEMRGDLERWKSEGRIFSVDHNGAEYFPVRALDAGANYRPRPAVKEILGIFGETASVWAIASWFAAANSSLDAPRPLDLLDEDPDQVVEAARDQLREISHG
jgi:hypothetical protein